MKSTTTICGLCAVLIISVLIALPTQAWAVTDFTVMCKLKERIATKQLICAERRRNTSWRGGSIFFSKVCKGENRYYHLLKAVQAV